MPNILFLDDSPIRCQRAQSALPSATIVTTVAEALTQLQRPDIRWDLVMLDHDLGGEELVHSGRADCGMEVVRWLLANPQDIGGVVVHTCNGSAGPQMLDALRTGDYHAYYFPFCHDLLLEAARWAEQFDALYSTDEPLADPTQRE